MKPLKTEVAFHTPFFDLLAKTLRSGEEPWYSLHLNDYTVIVPVTEDRQVLLVRQYRPAVEQFTLELPAGMVDANEEPEFAARRELLEETGYQAGHIQHLGPLFPDTGRLCNRIWGFLATGVRPVEGRTSEPGIETILYSMPQLSQSILSGEFNHSLHLAPLLAALLLRKISL